MRRAPNAGSERLPDAQPVHAEDVAQDQGAVMERMVIEVLDASGNVVNAQEITGFSKTAAMTLTRSVAETLKPDQHVRCMWTFHEAVPMHEVTP